MNKAILYGRVGKDPVIRVVSGDKKTASFSLATSRKSKDKETTQWHNIVLWDKLAELAEKYVTKGSALIVEGEIQYRKHDDKDGVTKYITEIVGRELHFAGSKPEKTSLDAAHETVQSKNDLDDLPY